MFDDDLVYLGLIEMKEMDAPEQWTVPQKFYKEINQNFIFTILNYI